MTGKNLARQTAETLAIAQAPKPMFSDEKQISEMTDGAVSVSQLRNWRWAGGGPPYIKLGRRVMYERQAVIDWLRQHSRTSTTDRDGVSS